jgi:hypothetical protein
MMTTPGKSSATFIMRMNRAEARPSCSAKNEVLWIARNVARLPVSRGIEYLLSPARAIDHLLYELSRARAIDRLLYESNGGLWRWEGVKSTKASKTAKGKLS